VKIVREWRGEASEDQFGWIARNIGDVDGDGVTDIVTSAPTHGANSSNAGRVYVYSVGSGKLLWKVATGGEIAMGPMTYQVNGKQYVAFAAGSSLFTFALK